MEEFITGKFTQLLDDVLPRLDKQPGRVIAVVPGIQIVWDDCCLGQLTARLVSLTPVLTNNAPMTRCGIKYWQAVGEVALLRCSTALEEDGSAPAPVKVLTEGVAQLSETEAVLQALNNQDWISSIGAWQPLGPNAGCRGFQLTFNFILDNPS
jgi:hypothetical protein